jgi:hypothetical protein
MGPIFTVQYLHNAIPAKILTTVGNLLPLRMIRFRSCVMTRDVQTCIGCILKTAQPMCTYLYPYLYKTS